MRTFILFLLVVFVTASVNYAQFSGNKWYIIEDAEDKIVFIDTSSVKQTDNLLSVWSMIDYREPFFSVAAQKDVKKVKTKYLFNTSSESFTVIGTIFYDATGRLVTDTEIPQLTGGNGEAYINIENETSIRKIYDKANVYNLTGDIEADPSEYLENLKDKNELPLQDSLIIAGNEVQEENEVEQSPIEPTMQDTSVGNSSTEEETTQPEIISPPAVEIPPVEIAEETSTEEEPPAEEVSDEYDISKERAVRGTIFTDGNLFCYQVSSWKRKNIAEQEKQKLIDTGFDGFIMEAEIPGRGTWYRVRVGYFNTLDEALASQRAGK